MQQLTKGYVAAVRSGKAQALEHPIVQVTGELVQKGTVYRTTVTDGQESSAAVFMSQLSDLVSSGQLKTGTLMRLKEVEATLSEGKTLLRVSEIEVLGQEGDTGFAFPALAASAAGTAGTPPPGKASAAGGAKQKENVPALSPSPYPSPEDVKSHKAAKLGEGLTPGAANSTMMTPPGWSQSSPPTLTPPSAAGKSPLAGAGASVTPVTKLATAPERKVYNKLDQLHPYDSSWTIKVKVSRKGPLRTAKSSIFSIDMVDDQGRAIQGTFWRAQAEKYSEVLQEGRVYVFSKFQVRVANKAYNNTNHDYEISFTDQTEVMEAADQDTSAMVVALNIVPITQLLKHVTRKASVDVMGVVVGLGALGNIKRKSNGEELTRRDVTLVDQGGRSVTVTLWGDAAASGSEALEGYQSLEGGDCMVLQISACKVTDFNGCSLSALPKSALTVDPDTDAARALKEWWRKEEHTLSTTFPSVGQEAAAARGSGGAAGAASNRLLVTDVSAAAKSASLPGPEAKPTYSEVVAVLGFVNKDNLYYQAHPETGKKVTQQADGTYASEDGRSCDLPEYRYVASARVCDFTGDVWVNLFNAEAEAMLGISAADMARLKEGDDGDEAVAARVKAAQHTQWVMTLASRTRDYNGERKMRHTVQAAKPLDNATYAAECRKLLDIIAKY